MKMDISIKNEDNSEAMRFAKEGVLERFWGGSLGICPPDWRDGRIDAASNLTAVWDG